MAYDLPNTRNNWPALAHAHDVLERAERASVSARQEVFRLRSSSAGVSIGDAIVVHNPRGSTTVKVGDMGRVVELDFTGGGGVTDRLQRIGIEFRPGGRPASLWPNSPLDFEVIKHGS